MNSIENNIWHDIINRFVAGTLNLLCAGDQGAVNKQTLIISTLNT